MGNKSSKITVCTIVQSTVVYCVSMCIANVSHGKKISQFRTQRIRCR